MASAYAEKMAARSDESDEEDLFMWTQPVCPYLDLHHELCGASLSGLNVARTRKESICHTERSDDCPMFLSKILTRPE